MKRRKLLSVKEVAAELRVSADIERRAYRKGELPAFRICKTLRFDLSTIHRLMRAKALLAAMRAGAVGDRRQGLLAGPINVRQNQSGICPKKQETFLNSPPGLLDAASLDGDFLTECEFPCPLAKRLAFLLAMDSLGSEVLSDCICLYLPNSISAQKRITRRKEAERIVREKEATMHRILAVLAVTWLVLGCQHGTAVPQTSRTATVHNVKLGMTEISPSELTVNVGDEVLFFNDRTQPVHLILIEGGRSIACQRGFTGYVDQEAQISPGGTASFCFERAGTFKYMARSKGVIEGAESVLPGQVHVQAGSSGPLQAQAKEHGMPARSQAELTAPMSVPETSRTANVQDVRIGLTNLSPTELSVDVGDEVRFINERADPVRIILIEAGKSIACKRGFSGSLDQEAEINPGESASFCFEKGGTAKYMVRSKPMGMVGGEKVLSAQILIREGMPSDVQFKEGSKPAESKTELTLTPKE